MIKITSHISLNEGEIKLFFIRSSGPGGQNVNKVATAVQLRFDVLHSPSLPDDIRQRLITLIGNNLTNEGELIIKASSYRTQERNKQDALRRLTEWIRRASIKPKKRKKTKPTASSVQRRLNKKQLHGEKKKWRRKLED